MQNSSMYIHICRYTYTYTHVKAGGSVLAEPLGTFASRLRKKTVMLIYKCMIGQEYV